MTLLTYDSTENTNSQAIINNKKYFVLPNDIHKIVKTPYQFIALTYLMRCTNNKELAYPTHNTITQGLMSTRKCCTALDELQDMGYITITVRNNTSNIYTVNIEKILNTVNNLPKELEL